MTAGSPETGTRLPIKAGDSLVLDTSVVIAYLAASEQASPAARLVIDQLVGAERNPGWISSVSVAEILVHPLRQGDRASAEAIKTFLLDFPGLNIRAADFLVAAEAARLRAATGASLPDAIIAATTRLTSSRWLLTNDRALADRLDGSGWAASVLLLSDITVRDA